jgi:hypothetical protein
LVERNELFGNSVGQNCIVSVSGAGSVFRNNFVRDNSGSLAVCAGDQALVELNTIANNGSVGVALRQGSGQVIRSNNILGHGTT